MSRKSCRTGSRHPPTPNRQIHMTETDTLSCVRIYADATGTSHFEDSELAMSSADFAPPAPPMQVSQFEEATRYGFVRAPSGWFGDWHPAPRRQLAFILGGEIEVGVAGGEVRRFVPGSMVLLEDTSGKGHTTRVVGSNPMVVAFVQLD